MINFDLWLESREDDGDFRTKTPITDQDVRMPIMCFDVQELTEQLASMPVGPLPGRSPFINEVRWGDGSSCVRVRVNTKNHVLLERAVHDLLGTLQWVCRACWRVNTGDFKGREGEVATAVHRVVEDVITSPLDAPSRSPAHSLEDLVEEIASRVVQAASDMFYYEGVRRSGRREYTVRFSMVGGGRGIVSGGTSGPSLVESSELRVSFDHAAGLFRVIHANVVKQNEGKDWVILPASFDEWFAPTQRAHEVAETVAASLRYF